MLTSGIKIIINGIDTEYQTQIMRVARPIRIFLFLQLLCMEKSRIFGGRGLYSGLPNDVPRRENS